MKLYSVLMAKVMLLLIESQQLQNKVLRGRGNIITKDEEIETLGYWSRNIPELKLRKATSTTRSYCIAPGTIFTILYNKPDRKEIINETGFIFPQIRIREDSKLQENECIIYVQGTEVYREFFICNKEEIKKEIKNLIKKIYDEHLEEIFTNELFEQYISHVQKKNAWLIWNITQVLFVSDIKYLLISLLKHNKSIKNISLVFEKMGKILKNSDRWSSSLNLSYLEFKLNNIV